MTPRTVVSFLFRGRGRLATARQWHRQVILASTAVCLMASALVGQTSDTIVVSATKPRHQGVAELVEEVTLGAGSDAEEFSFTRAFVAPGREGGVYVIDWRGMGASSVRLYDRDGKYIRTFGRNGQGPGEYVHLVGDVRELPDGRVLLSDGLGVLVYSATGQPLGRWEAKARALNVGSSILVDPRGFIYTYGLHRTDPRATLGTLFLYRFDLNGKLTETVPAPEAEFPTPARRARIIVPFVPGYLVAWSPQGYFVTSYTATYAVDFRRAVSGSAALTVAWQQGDPVTSLRRTVPPVQTHAGERSDWRQNLTMAMRQGRTTPKWEWVGPDIPRLKPPISGVSIASDGRVWVRLSQTARLNSAVSIPNVPTTRMYAPKRWAEPQIYDVFEANGTYVGQVRLPDRTESFSADGDIVWAVSNDQDDVPTVRRYRIRWAK
jgi:hypothetical protein